MAGTKLPAPIHGSYYRAGACRHADNPGVGGKREAEKHIFSLRLPAVHWMELVTEETSWTMQETGINWLIATLHTKIRTSWKDTPAQHWILDQSSAKDWRKWPRMIQIGQYCTNIEECSPSLITTVSQHRSILAKDWRFGHCLTIACTITANIGEKQATVVQ